MAPISVVAQQPFGRILGESSAIRSTRRLLGKIATWLLYASLFFVTLTPAGTDWPLVVFWAGFVLAVAALVQYALKARREVRT